MRDTCGSRRVHALTKKTILTTFAEIRNISAPFVEHTHSHTRTHTPIDGDFARQLCPNVKCARAYVYIVSIQARDDDVWCPDTQVSERITTNTTTPPLHNKRSERLAYSHAYAD